MSQEVDIALFLKIRLVWLMLVQNLFILGISVMIFSADRIINNHLISKNYQELPRELNGCFLA